MSETSPILPYEIIDVVAQHLVAVGHFATCASLNIASHAVFEATLKTLWTHVCWTPDLDLETDREEEILKAKWAVLMAARGAQYIRQALQFPGIKESVPLTLGFRYMIEPLESTRVYRPSTTRLRTLCPNMEASVAIELSTRTYVEISLFENYEYSVWARARLWQALNTVAVFFEEAGTITTRPEMALCIHGMRRNHGYCVGLQPLRSDHDHVSVEANHAIPNRITTVDTRLIPKSTFSLSPCIDPVTVHLDAFLAGDNSQELEHYYTPIWTLVFNFLRPWADAFLEKKGKDIKWGPCLRVARLGDSPSTMSFVSTYMRLCSLDPVYTTYKIIYSSSEEDLEETRLTAMFDSLGVSFSKASGTVPHRSLGEFSFHNGVFGAHLGVDGLEMKLTTNHYSTTPPKLFAVYPLADPPPLDMHLAEVNEA